MNAKQLLLGLLGSLMFVLLAGAIAAVFTVGYLLWRWVTSS